MKAIVLDMYGVIVRQTGDDCIYIDDREGNLEAAKKVGMKTVLLNSRNVSYEGVSVDSFDELAKEILSI